MEMGEQDQNVGQHGEPPTTEHSTSYRPFPSFSEWDAGEFEDSVFARNEALLQQRREVAGEAALTAAVVTATRSAAVDTGAIEGLYQVDRGFTRTVATQAAAWEATVASRGEHVVRAIDDALRAYEFVLDAATESAPVSEVWIRQLHATICASQETYTVYTPVGPQQRPLPKGTYKTMPNNPSNASTGRIHHYAPVSDVGAEMARLVDELRSDAFQQAHPVTQAAYAHYAYVCIHPFADGNGRVARALSSAFLYRRPGVPLVVFADQRDQYLDALEAADAGNSRLFINFIESCVVDTVGVVCASVHPDVQSAALSLAAMERFYASTTSEAEFDTAAVRLAKLLHDELQAQVEALPRSEMITVRVQRLSSMPKNPTSYRQAARQANTHLVLSSAPPARAQLFLGLAVFVRNTPEASSDFAIASDVNDEVLEVALREIVPAVSATLRLKVAGWVDGQVAGGMAQLLAAAEVSWKASRG
ncbi:Fic family protein [Modestobacter marinus]|uniref:Fic family protein n=1 Tax=Modestobacter marinus TaxID=477641 RepID=A0A846LPK9_9ACTN|nr:Fic family protein [Modestobacter marinus]NIH69411.1 Fic family protein [Modestobacter marinus]GGL73543.1 hypothetical protein GCM10011589_32100 [Modestobacter marinus]